MAARPGWTCWSAPVHRCGSIAACGSRIRRQWLSSKITLVGSTNWSRGAALNSGNLNLVVSPGGRRNLRGPLAAAPRRRSAALRGQLADRGTSSALYLSRRRRHLARTARFAPQPTFRVAGANRRLGWEEDLRWSCAPAVLGIRFVRAGSTSCMLDRRIGQTAAAPQASRSLLLAVLLRSLLPT